MPTLDVSELNIVISVLGAFTVLFGVISVKIKQVWYLGEALPAVVFGIALGPIAASFIDSERWGSAMKDQTEYIALGATRVVIGIQLVMAGYQLPAKYPWHRWKDMALLLIPVMTIMWLCTTACIMLMIPNLTTLTAMVIGSLVTSTDPVLSQAIAKGPFADKYVPRALREIISAEAASNDGFGFPFLFLATFLIRHADHNNLDFKPGVQRIHGEGAHGDGAHRLMPRAGDIGRLGGGTGQAIELWLVEGWLYFILLGAIAGAVAGTISKYAACYSLRSKWIDSESLLLFPTALGLFVIGFTGCAGLDDLIACFCAGAALNWNGVYLEETLERHDEVNGCIDVLLNLGGFMFIGAILPWDQFNQPEAGITYGRLFALGVLVLLLRRIPAMMVMFKLMPNTVKTWKEALFMGYFGPIGIGAVFYVEHARHLYPRIENAETEEEEHLLRAMVPIVYFLVLFSIVIHGLSIPALELIYRWRNVPPIVEMDPDERRPRSVHEALPNNAHIDYRRGSVVRHNRFSRTTSVGPSICDRASFDDLGLSRRFSQESRISRVPTAHMSMTRQQPMSPVMPGVGPGPTFRKQSMGTDSGRDSEQTLHQNEEGERGRPREKPRLTIQFDEESATTARQRDDDGGLDWGDGRRYLSRSRGDGSRSPYGGAEGSR